MPNYKCECPMVFGGDDAQRDRDIHMDSCEFRKIRIERDAALLQVGELTKDLAHWKDCHGATADKLEESNRLNDTLLNILDELKPDDVHPSMRDWYKRKLEEVRKPIENRNCDGCGRLEVDCKCPRKPKSDCRPDCRLCKDAEDGHGCSCHTEKRNDEVKQICSTVSDGGHGYCAHYKPCPFHG